MARSFSEECSYIEPVSDYCYKIKKGFVPNMKVGPSFRSALQIIRMFSVILTSAALFPSALQVEGLFYVNDFLKKLMYDELKHHCAAQGKRIA